MKDRSPQALADALYKSGAALVSSCCAALMLCVVPLVFRDAFFDINRIKVYTVYAGVPVMAAAMVAALLFSRGAQPPCLPERCVLLCFGAMAMFLLSCLFSYFSSGFDAAALLGNQGRYCGLLFFLCCGMAFYLIACGASASGWVHGAAVLCAALIAFLGVLNALGIDPLGFYARIRKGQEQMFMSTIGHFDFFGTYLVLMLPLAGGLHVFSQKKEMRILGLVGAALMAMGAAASRTDSALIGVHLGCAALSALSGGSLVYMARAFALWAICFASLPVVGALFEYGSLGVAFSGPHKLLCETDVALIAVLALLAAARACLFLAKRGVRAPGRKKTVALMLIVLLLAFLLFLGTIVYFTVFSPQSELGGASGFLRFDDAWGSYRGFVYTRAVDAFAAYFPIEKLFGKGLDTTRLILSPYFDNPVIGIVGVFDDAHSQLLQLLLTGGLLGALSFAAFYAVVLTTLYRHAGRDPLVCGAAASVFAYLIVMLINVTQPILIAVYFSICGLGLSRIGYIEKRRRNNG